MERKRQELAEEGIGVAAVSYDSREILEAFTERVGVGFPLLSDPESEIIRRFRIFNEDVDRDSPAYGIPNPGEYLIGADGVVQAKFFEDNIRERFTAGRVLSRSLGAEAGAAATRIETDHLTLTSWSSDAIVLGGNHFTLGLDIELPEKMHVYAPGVEGYLEIEWTMQATDGLETYDIEFPEPEILHLPAINERVPVYEGSFRLVRDVKIGQKPDIAALLDADNRLTLRGKLRFQACDDRVCYLPETLDLEWALDFQDHDRTRAPEALRRMP